MFILVVYVILSPLMWQCHESILTDMIALNPDEPRREKTGLQCFRPGLTQTDLYSHRSRLEA